MARGKTPQCIPESAGKKEAFIKRIFKPIRSIKCKTQLTTTIHLVFIFATFCPSALPTTERPGNIEGGTEKGIFQTFVI